ncbi:hypothetical protein C0Q70_07969 [Pomacea canaliculata]|uniref:Uncharacterized protein n=2 Tax=Pomacea canaliculata TaxID=400727 RepID=A0A2T7PGI7_POMCA|nr:hypothetical protein C0Q70_07969 [Pomacea canaliculata]
MGDELFRFFQAHPRLSHAILTRKGRITAREVITSFGDNGYLSDTFCVGQVVQRAKVLVRETLVCSGRGNCQRLCGGFGQCMKDCQERRKRGSMGHRCRLKVKLTMSTDHFGTWKVVISGRHVPPGRVWRPPTKSALTDHEKRQELEEAWIAGCHGVREIALAVGDDSLTKAEIQNFIRTKRRQLRTVAWQPHHAPRTTNRPRHHPWQLSHPPALLRPAPEVSLAPQVPFVSEVPRAQHPPPAPEPVPNSVDDSDSES